MKKFIITEEDRHHILKLYGLIKENIDPNVGGTVTIPNNYKPGWYSITKDADQQNQEMGQKIANELAPVINFVKTNPNSIVEIVFISQESAIPNFDNEGNAGKTWLEVGALSELRYQYLNQWFQTYFNDLKEKGIIKNTVDTPPIKFDKKLPDTPWVGTPFCPKNSTEQQQRSTCYNAYKAGKTTKYKEYFDKYQKEQRSDIQITVKKKETPTPTPTPTTQITKTIPTVECVEGLTIRVFVERHQCNNAEFLIYANNTLLQNTKGGWTANLNNADTSMGVPNSSAFKLSKKELNPGYGKLPNGDDTTSYGKDGNIGKYRSDTFIITKEQAASIIQQGNGYITIWMISTTKRAHRDIQSVVISRKGKTILQKNIKAVKSKLVTLDGCGTEEITTPITPEPQPPTERGNDVRKIVSGRASGSQRDFAQGDAGNQDSKQQILEYVGDLLDKIRELRNFISKQYTNKLKDNPKLLDEYKKRLSEEYNYYLTVLDKGHGGMTFRRDENKKYVDKTIRKGKEALFGDIKADLDIFYQYFDGIYLSWTPAIREGKKLTQRCDQEKIIYYQYGSIDCLGIPRIGSIINATKAAESQFQTEL